MRKYFLQVSIVILTWFISSCQSESVSDLIVQITLLDQGKVRIEADANGAVLYRFSFGDSSEYYDQKSGVIEYTYKNKGEYVVSVRAFFNEKDLEDNTVKVANISITSAFGSGTSGEFIDSSEEAIKYEGYELVFSDEFNNDGKPNEAKWHFQTEPIFGSSWANGELQHYTSRIDNAKVSDGVLKIIAKREDYSFAGSSKRFTSARLNSKFDFLYGRVDVRAKLPSSAGTWPAIWTLGSNVNERGNYFGSSRGSVGWPECGEIDIMEQYGGDKSKVLGTFHWRDETSGSHAMYPQNGQGLEIENTSTEFHLYSMIWNANSIQIFVDNILVVQMNNKTSEEEFRNPHYLLLNIAMGGSLGGSVPDDFKEDSMEIDFVRVYQ
jgi:beta-glucanase (GH16 family)